jgi:periplasmic protein TonB
MTKHLSFASSFVASALVHLIGFGLAVALLTQRSYRYQPNLISVSLWEFEPEDKPVPAVKEHPKAERAKSAPAPIQGGTERREKLAPPVHNEPSKASPSDTPPQPAPQSSVTEPAAPEGGSTAGISNLATGDSAVAPGSGSAGGGGTAVAGLGRGSGAAAMPLQTGPLRTNREAKPVQTARASYPPMALRLGLEGDVMLRIEVDPAGNVTRVEIIKSGGAAFDEEALKAVRQSRFEPAQRDGQNIAAEFNYVYRFRLQR